MHNRVENAQLVARRIICTRSYVQRAQLGRECTIFKCVTTTRLCHLQGILPKLALLAYIDTLVVQPKRTHNKSVVHLKNTRDRRPLAVSNQKGWNAALSLNFKASEKLLPISFARGRADYSTDSRVTINITAR